MTAQTLDAAGYRGFTRFQDLRDGGLARVPQAAGAYVVLRRPTSTPSFAAESCGGHFKGKNPTVAIALLQAKWVEEAEVVYVGKASNLRGRLKQYADYGAGKPVGHQGGRYIWQLTDSDALLVAWKPSDADQPASTLEAKLVGFFKSEHGRLPFANIADPTSQAL
jgi:hypothetical protein